MPRNILLPKFYDRPEIPKWRRLNEDLWFKKFQPLLLWMANTREGRDLLCIKQSFPRIYEISKKHIKGLLGFQNSRIYWRSRFSVGAKYANIIRYRWSEFLFLARYYQAYGAVKFPIKGLAVPVFNVLDDYFPDPNPETTTVDGLVGREGVASATWATIRSGVGNAADDATSDQTFCRTTASSTTDQYVTLDRFVMGFDASSIDDTDSIDSVTFDLRGTGKNDNLALSTVVDHRTAPATATALVAGDFDIAAWDNVDQTGEITITAFSTAGDNTYTANATGRGNVSKTVASWFGLRLTQDVDNVGPTWSSGLVGSVLGNNAEAAGTGDDPTMNVDHSAAAPASSVLRRRMLLGVGA